MNTNNSNDLFRVVNKTMKFGILVKVGITNSHYRQEHDLLKHLKKLDVYTYLEEFDRTGYTSTEDLIDDCVAAFEREALWVKAQDSEFDGGSSFYLVCYLTDEGGNPTDMAKIRELFYVKHEYPKRKWTTKIWDDGSDTPRVMTRTGCCSAADAMQPHDYKRPGIVRVEVTSEDCE